MAAEYIYEGTSVHAELAEIHIRQKVGLIELVCTRVDKTTFENLPPVRINVTGEEFADLLTRIGPTIKAESWACIDKNHKAELVGADPDADLSGVAVTVV